MKRIVALVPIKLNSQRLANKNILPIAGRPLCWHICSTLTAIDVIDRVCVYCSDEGISDYLPSGVEVIKRPKWLDEDNVKGFDIYKEFINSNDADIYVLAHTTSPFLKKETIENALKKVVDDEYDSAFSAERIQTFAWYMGKPINYLLTDVPRTQDMEPIFVETSGFYIFKKEVFTESNRRIGTRPYLQEVYGDEAIDIDEKKDYELACAMAELRMKEPL